MLESAAMAHSPVTVEPAVAPGAFKPFVPASESPAEFTVKAVVLGAIFGIIFGAVTVYLALRAGLTVSASIPIAVLAIAVFKRFSRSTILENNIVQTIGSAGESIAAGVVFTIPAFLFIASGGAQEYFNIVQIVTLAAVGGIIGVLMMVPMRRALIVKEHGILPYPEGTACAEVLKAGASADSRGASAPFADGEAQAASGRTIFTADPDVVRRYNDRLQKDMQKMVFSGGCNAWYTDSHDRNFTLWPYSALRFLAEDSLLPDPARVAPRFSKSWVVPPGTRTNEPFVASTHRSPTSTLIVPSST